MFNIFRFFKKKDIIPLSKPASITIVDKIIFEEYNNPHLNWGMIGKQRTQNIKNNTKSEGNYHKSNKISKPNLDIGSTPLTSKSGIYSYFLVK